MTPGNAIKAGALALTSKCVRELFETRQPVTISTVVAGRTVSVQLDPVATRAALDATDANLAERMKRLGVAVE